MCLHAKRQLALKKGCQIADNLTLKERIRTATPSVGLGQPGACPFFTGRSAGTSLPGRKSMAGEPRSSTGSPATFVASSREWEGFSPRNLKYMRAFALAWPEEAIVQQAAAQIPRFHNACCSTRSRTQSEREWYVQETINNGWSRNVLVPIRHALQQTVRLNRVVSHRDPHDTLIAHSDGLATWEPNYFVVGAAQRRGGQALGCGLRSGLGWPRSSAGTGRRPHSDKPAWRHQVGSAWCSVEEMR